MQQRSLLTVGLLSIFTLGIYSFIWFVKTKGELNARGAQIPTAWLIIVPIANLYWMWRYYEGAEQITNGQSNALLNFLLGLFVTSLIPQLMLQSEYNKISSTPLATAPVAGAAPAPASDQPVIPPSAGQTPAAPTPSAEEPQQNNTPSNPQPPLVQ